MRCAQFIFDNNIVTRPDYHQSDNFSKISFQIAVSSFSGFQLNDLNNIFVWCQTKYSGNCRSSVYNPIQLEIPWGGVINTCRQIMVNSGHTGSVNKGIRLYSVLAEVNTTASPSETPRANKIHRPRQT